MNKTKLNTLKVIIAFLSLIIVYSIVIRILKPIFSGTSALTYLAVIILLALAFFILIPFLIFQFRGRE